MKVGSVAIIGRPNVGKSTLLNAILGQKLAIVTNKPNTTRILIDGILTTEDYQIIFYDTPGIHVPKSRINKLMVKQSHLALELADIIYLIVTPKDFIGQETKGILDLLEEYKKIKILLINKIDIFRKEDVINIANKFNERGSFEFILPISALKTKNIDLIINTTVPFLKERDPIYNEDLITTTDNKLIIAEFVREQVYKVTEDEVPYNILVECEEAHINDQNTLYASVIINVNRESQKGMIIGKNGSVIKQIGINARKNLEELFDSKVYLDLWVKIRNNWMVDKKCLKIQGLL
jgi:GTP-binding protein Era